MEKRTWGWYAKQRERGHSVMIPEENERWHRKHDPARVSDRRNLVIRPIKGSRSTTGKGEPKHNKRRSLKRMA